MADPEFLAGAFRRKRTAKRKNWVPFGVGDTNAMGPVRAIKKTMLLQVCWYTYICVSVSVRYGLFDNPRKCTQ